MSSPPQSSSPASTIREIAFPIITEQTSNSTQQPSCETNFFRDHITALTKLMEDAPRLIIPVPHFRGYQDFTTLVNEEIKRPTSEEFQRRNLVELFLDSVRCSITMKTRPKAAEALRTHCVNGVKIHQGNMKGYGITVDSNGKVTGIGCN